MTRKISNSKDKNKKHSNSERNFFKREFFRTMLIIFTVMSLTWGITFADDIPLIENVVKMVTNNNEVAPQRVGVAGIVIDIEESNLTIQKIYNNQLESEVYIVNATNAVIQSKDYNDLSFADITPGTKIIAKGLLKNSNIEANKIFVFEEDLDLLSQVGTFVSTAIATSTEELATTTDELATSTEESSSTTTDETATSTDMSTATETSTTSNSVIGTITDVVGSVVDAVTGVIGGVIDFVTGTSTDPISDTDNDIDTSTSTDNTENSSNQLSDKSGTEQPELITEEVVEQSLEPVEEERPEFEPSPEPESSESEPNDDSQ
jgi:hypothetical protein